MAAISIKKAKQGHAMSKNTPQSEKPSNSHLTKSPARLNEFTGGLGFGPKGAYAEMEMGTQGGHFMVFEKAEIQRMLNSKQPQYFNEKSLERAIAGIDAANESGVGARMKNPNSAATLSRADYAAQQTSKMADGPEKTQRLAELNAAPGAKPIEPIVVNEPKAKPEIAPIKFAQGELGRMSLSKLAAKVTGMPEMSNRIGFRPD